MVQVASSRKVSCIILCLLCFVVLCTAQTPLNLQQQVQLPKHEWPLDELMQQVTKQTGVRFSINTRKFPSSRKLHIKKLKQPVSQLLAEIKQTTGIAYTQVGTHIIMLDQLPGKKPAPASFTNPAVLQNTAPAKVPVKNKKNGNNPKPANLTLTEMKNNAVSDQDHSNMNPSVAGESALKPTIVPSSAAILLKPATASIAISSSAPFYKSLQRSLVRNSAINAAAANSSTSSSRSRSKNEFEKYTGFFSSVGSSADDALYAHSSIMGGHTFAYGIIGYTSNFRRGGLYYGIGSSFPLSSRWNIHVQLSTRKLNFKFDSGINVIKVISTNWHQAALKMEYKISKQLRLQFGPVYNLLKSKMSFNNIPGDYLTDLELYMMGNHVHTIYTIKDEFSKEKGTLLKSWIGLQAGIYFNLDFSK